MTADPKKDFIKPLDEALVEMKHLCLENLRGRPVPLFAVYDADGWHCWIPTPDGRIAHLRPIDTAEGKYLAEAPADPDDLYFPFLDFFVQRLPSNDLLHWLDAIVDDLWCLSTSMAKLEFFYRSSLADKHLDFSWMVGTEIEYIVSVLRNVYDLLQEVIVLVWKSIQLHGCDRKNQELRKSFADMTMRADTLMSAADIASARNVPDWLAAYYAACARSLQISVGTATNSSTTARSRACCLSPTKVSRSIRTRSHSPVGTYGTPIASRATSHRSVRCSNT